MEAITFMSKFCSFFQLCAFFVWPLTDDKKTHSFKLKTLNFISLCHLTVAISLILFAYYNGSYFVSFTKKSSAKFNEYVQMMVPLMSHVILIIDSWYQQQLQAKLWWTVNEIERIVKRENIKLVNALNRDFVRSYSWTFSVLMLIGLIPEVFLIVYVYNDARKWSNMFIIRLFAFIATRINVLHFILYVDYLRSRLKFMGSELKHIVLNLQHPANDKIVYEKLMVLRKLYTLIWDANFGVQHRFGWSVAISIMGNFIHSIINLYWVYIRLHLRRFPSYRNCKCFILFSPQMEFSTKLDFF